MKKRTPLVILAVCQILALALVGNPVGARFDELTTKSGKRFRQVTVTGADPSGITVIHASGAARVVITDVPDDILAQLGVKVDLEKAREFERARRQAIVMGEATRAREAATAKEVAQEDAAKRLAESPRTPWKIVVSPFVTSTVAPPVIWEESKPASESFSRRVPETWTSHAGETILATFVRLDSERQLVVLRLPDGRNIEVPLRNLAEFSRARAQLPSETNK